MIRYVPFLKAKRGELAAMGALDAVVKQAFCPFFDFPRNNDGYDLEAYIKTTRRIVSSLRRHWGADAEFYFDDFDVGQELQVQGQDQYAFVIKALGELRAIPVVSLGRSEHNAAVARIKRGEDIASPVLAFRADQDDFEDFEEIEDEVRDELAPVFADFEAVDLILDCRLCRGTDVSTASQQIAAFTEDFCNAYTVRRVIVTGSSIPGSIRDVLDTDSATTVPRTELDIIDNVRALTERQVTAGDYATVSPLFADKNFARELFQKVTAPRLTYSFDRSHYIARGTSLALGGQDQYFGLIQALCEKPFFRGRGYSPGEDYFDDKRQRIGNGATNAVVVKPSVVAHITYMVRDANF